MYKPSLIRALGRHLPNPPIQKPKVMQHEELIAILHKITDGIFAIKVTGHFDYEMFMGDFLNGYYTAFELYILDAEQLDDCRLDD